MAYRPGLNVTLNTPISSKVSRLHLKAAYFRTIVHRAGTYLSQSLYSTTIHGRS